MTDIEDFSNYPRSLAEIKSDKEQDARVWTPRDALIDLLREIDRGAIDTDALVIAFRVKIDGAYGTRFRAASPDTHVTLGLCEMAKFKMLGLL